MLQTYFSWLFVPTPIIDEQARIFFTHNLYRFVLPNIILCIGAGLVGAPVNVPKRVDVDHHDTSLQLNDRRDQFYWDSHKHCPISYAYWLFIVWSVENQ